MQLSFSSCTDVGRTRDHNEDYLGWHVPGSDTTGPGHLFVVADGVGGGAAGEEASRTAVETFIAGYLAAPRSDAESALRQAAEQANEAVTRDSLRDGRATTLVSAAIRDDELTVLNVGDSRAYLVRGGEIRQITRDHSWVQEQVRAGLMTPDVAEYHPQASVITRWVGGDAAEPDVFHEGLAPNDRIILCSDGLIRHVQDDSIARVISTMPPADAASELVRLANDGGGRDNITVIVVALGTDPAPEVAKAKTPRRGRTRRIALFASGLLVLAIAAAIGVSQLSSATEIVTPTEARVPGATAVSISVDDTVAIADLDGVELHSPSASSQISRLASKFKTLLSIPDQDNSVETWAVSDARSLAALDDGSLVAVTGGGTIQIRMATGEAREVRLPNSGSSAELMAVAAMPGARFAVLDRASQKVRTCQASADLATAVSCPESASIDLRKDPAVTDPRGLAADSHDRLYVGDGAGGEVAVFESNGTRDHALPLPKEARQPVALSHDGVDTLYAIATDQQGQAGQRHLFRQSAGGEWKPYSDSRRLSNPIALATAYGKPGSVWIVDGDQTRRLEWP